MTFARAQLAAVLRPSTFDVLVAQRGAHSLTSPRARMLAAYQETPLRRNMRQLLDAAALTGAQVRLGFCKVSTHEMRYMVAIPCVGADGTARFYTVQDVELSDLAERVVYRRVCLDSIASLQIEYRAAEAGVTQARSAHP